MNYKDTFSKRLKELREKNSLTQRKLAQLLNTSHQAVGWWEQGRRFPGGESLIKIADYFNTSIDYLVGKLDK